MLVKNDVRMLSVCCIMRCLRFLIFSAYHRKLMTVMASMMMMTRIATLSFFIARSVI